MTPTNESVLTEELIERVRKLDSSSKSRLVDILLHDESEDDPEEVAKAWKEEIARRIEALDAGKMQTYTFEETMEYLRAVANEGRS